jgi:hypothetical protein
MMKLNKKFIGELTVNELMNICLSPDWLEDLNGCWKCALNDNCPLQAARHYSYYDFSKTPLPAELKTEEN